MGMMEQNLELRQAVARVAKWEEDGTLERVDRLLHFLNAAVDSFTPEIVESLVETISTLVELGDKMMQSRLMDLVPVLMTAADTVGTKTPETKRGMTKLMKRLRDPEVQDGLQFMLEFVKAIGQGVSTGDSGLEKNG